MEAILALAEGLLARGTTAEAGICLDMAEKIKKHPQISFLRASMALNAGDRQSARKYLEEYRRLAGDQPHALIEYARFLETLGATSESLPVYRKLQECASGTPWVEEAQSAIERLSCVKTAPMVPFIGRTPIPGL